MLAGQSGEHADVVIQRRHVERALAADSETEPTALISLLWRAARAFVQEAQRQKDGSAALTLDLTEAFRGMVLAAALEHTGSREEAFTLLGREPMLKSRNHHRALRREIARVRELLRVLGGEVDRELEAMLDAGEEEER
jgi:hypothetical protein